MRLLINGKYVDDDDDDDEDEYEDFDDDYDPDDDDDDDEDDDKDDDVYDVLEYMDVSQIQSRDEIIGDIKLYLKDYQPMYKIVKKKDH